MLFFCFRLGEYFFLLNLAFRQSAFRHPCLQFGSVFRSRGNIENVDFRMCGHHLARQSDVSEPVTVPSQHMKQLMHEDASSDDRADVPGEKALIDYDVVSFVLLSCESFADTCS